MADTDQLRAERDGYKLAYDTLAPVLGYLRSVAAPVIRENVAPELAEKPGVFLATLPKSATVFIGQSLRRTLGYDFTSTIVTNTWPKNVVWEPMAWDFARGGMVAATHMQPDGYNLDVLKRFGIRKIVVHMRDPRAALSSWFHFRTAYGQAFTDLERLSHVAVPMSETFRSANKAVQMDHFIQYFFEPCVEWIKGWLDAIDNDRELNILLRTHEYLATDETGYFQTILDFYGLDAKIVAAEKTDMTHFRKGDNTSWREDLTADQLNFVNSRIPASIAYRLGWVA